MFFLKKIPMETIYLFIYLSIYLWFILLYACHFWFRKMWFEDQNFPDCIQRMAAMFRKLQITYDAHYKHVLKEHRLTSLKTL